MRRELSASELSYGSVCTILGQISQEVDVTCYGDLPSFLWLAVKTSDEPNNTSYVPVCVYHPDSLSKAMTFNEGDWVWVQGSVLSDVVNEAPFTYIEALEIDKVEITEEK